MPDGRHFVRELVRGISLFLTFCTGLSALVYEVAWQRYLANFLGSAAQATAIILAVFLGGLCIGYRIFGNVSSNRSPRTLLLLCGISEFIIGIWAVIFPDIYEAMWRVSGVVDPVSIVSFFWEFAISIALIGVPTVLMGGTLPLLTQGLSYDLEDSRGFHARVYASNTAGAFVGALLAGFYFLPNWGLHGTVRSLGCMNIVAGMILAGAAFLLSSQVVEAETEAETPATEEEGWKIGLRPAYAVAAIAGFSSLCLQTVFIRLVALTMGASEYAFSMVVAVFVCMLSVGSWLVAARDRKNVPVWRNQLGVFIGTIAVYYTTTWWGYICHLARLNLMSFVQTFYMYYAIMFLLIAAVLSLPVGMMGATMPRLFASVSTSRRDLGAVVGRLYAWNTIGCVLGALCGGYWLLFYWNLDSVYKLCVALAAISMGIAFPWQKSGKTSRSVMGGLLAVCAIVVAITPAWDKIYFGMGLFRVRRPYAYTWDGPQEFYKNYVGSSEMIFYRDGPASTVAVGETPGDESTEALNDGAKMVRNLRVNGKSDGETSYGDMRTMRLVAHLPVLLSTEPVKKVGVIGFGLGIAAGSTTIYPEVETVKVMEISPAVIWAAPLFDFANYGVTKSPKIQIQIGDAYRTLAASKEKFDVLISEPTNPWVTGVERLFAKEFYEIVQKQLNKHGIYAQWIHEYSLRDETLELVFRTFMSSFPHVRTFRTDRDIIMLGSFEEIGQESVRSLLSRYNASPNVRKALSQVAVPNVPALFGLELWLTKEQFPGDIYQTLSFPRLALMAGRDFFLDVDVNLAEMLDDPIRRMWTRVASRKSLITHIMPSGGPDRAFALASYTKAACDIEQLAFVTGWESMIDSCKTALVAAGLEGDIIPLPTGREADIIGVLRTLREEQASPDLRSWMQAVPSLDPKQADAMMGLFERYTSIFEHLSVEKLLVIAVACNQLTTDAGLSCRKHFVRALATTGYPKFAREALSELTSGDKPLISRVEAEVLQEIVDAADKAFVRTSSKQPESAHAATAPNEPQAPVASPSVAPSSSRQ